jgi:hypothetical protein
MPGMVRVFQGRVVDGLAETGATVGRPNTSVQFIFKHKSINKIE